LYDIVALRVAEKWWDLGVQLLVSDERQIATLIVIAANYPQNVVKCCQTMFEEWLEIRNDASWNQLIEALKSPGIELLHLASEIS